MSVARKHWNLQWPSKLSLGLSFDGCPWQFTTHYNGNVWIWLENSMWFSAIGRWGDFRGSLVAIFRGYAACFDGLYDGIAVWPSISWAALWLHSEFWIYPTLLVTPWVRQVDQRWLFWCPGKTLNWKFEDVKHRKVRKSHTKNKTYRVSQKKTLL